MRHEEARYHLIAYHHQQMDIDAQPWTPITTAGAPFNDPTDNVDLVIRTADNVEFFVLSVLLTLRSPSSFFRHALQDSKHTEERNSLPILEVTEDSDTFRTILLFCYPDVAPKIKSVEQFQAVGVALDKYCMDRAMGRLVEAVLASSMISEQPLRVFALAVANGWKKLGEAAARNTLVLPLRQAISDVEELNIITARHLYRRCGEAAQIQAGEEMKHPWVNGKTSGLRFLQPRRSQCQWCNRKLDYVMREETESILGEGQLETNYIYGHPWLSDTYFLLVNAKVLLEPRPQVALDDHIVDQAVLASTKQCNSAHHDKWTSIAGSQIRLLGKILAEEIERRISEVPLDIEWQK
ncbi:hypothetical protein EV421DRAFT_1909093 [Armillaria borealis]|uniref:BTB domain-containing protein n=1 Tax=Armillaria borealis TaxID=47425 RepID=A0AA39MHR5_9AGAR|nr:hypothetical protein EV421DRAFT_1909093 [Armillaria borealis]